MCKDCNPMHSSTFWKKFDKEKPPRFGRYLVYYDMQCKECEQGTSHSHRLEYEESRIDIALWSAAHTELVKHYQSQGDNSWDWAAIDHWSENSMNTEYITHWMELPLRPLSVKLMTAPIINPKLMEAMGFTRKPDKKDG